MRFLIYVWTQIFLMGVGGIAGVVCGKYAGGPESPYFGAGIGAVVGILLARYMLSFASHHAPSVVTAGSTASGKLFACDDCGRMISRHAIACPQCGRPMTN